MSDELIADVQAALGPEGVLTGADVSSRAVGIWTDERIRARAIFRPRTTAEVAAVLRACNEARQTVVTHGGLTGLVEGALATQEDVRFLREAP